MPSAREVELGGFVGRTKELAELEALAHRAALGPGRFVLISGEAGIGKTALAGEIARRAASVGYDVRRAACWEGDGTPAFWPWSQIVRSQASEVSETGASVRDLLHHMAPGLGAGRGHTTAGQYSGESRVLLFHAIAELLRARSGLRPQLVMLDDLHWADEPSLRALAFCVHHLRDAPIIFLGAYRDTEFDHSGPLGRQLGELTRLADSFTLAGLEEEDVASLISAWTDPFEELVRAVHLQSGGNPLFVKEVVRLLAGQGRIGRGSRLDVSVAIPPGAREVIEHHIERLSGSCLEILETGAVLGQEFSIEVLEACSDVDHESLLELVDEAIKAKVLEESAPAGKFRFHHALVRQTLYEGLGTVRRRRLHRRIASRLESLLEVADEVSLPFLSHHFVEALPLTDEDKAVTYCILAGERAMDALAYEDAALHFGRALRVLSSMADDPRRCEVLLALGDARWRAGDVDAARTVLFEAAGVARSLGAGELLARAAIGCSTGVGGQGYTFQADVKIMGLLEAALQLLDPRHEVLCVRLQARLATQLYWADQVERGNELSRSAVALAERIGEPRLLLEALYSSEGMHSMQPEFDARALSIVEQICTSETGDLELLFWAHQHRLGMLARQGDGAGVEVSIDACDRLANELRMPRYRWQVKTWRLGRALSQAEIGRARKLAAESLELTHHFESDAAMFVYAAQMGVLLWMEGRFDELEQAMTAYSDRYPWVSAWPATQAWLYADAGRIDDCRSVFERLAAGGFSEIRRNPGRPVSLWTLALPCFLVGDEASAAVLASELAPYRDVTIAMGGMVFSFGSTLLPLGLLAAARGRLDEACRLLQEAAEANERQGNELMRVLALRERAAVLLIRDREGDRRTATRILDDVLARIERRGLEGLEARARRLAEEAETGGAEGMNVLRKEGEYWSATFRGRTVRLRDRKGLRDLATLLASPGRDFHVSELVAATEGGEPQLVASALSGGADEQLDARGAESYRRRIVDLQDEVDDAEMTNDSLRAARARSELDLLAGELASAYGLGGRPRRDGHPAERARKAVAWRVRDVLRGVEGAHPELARHLTSSVRTGTFCGYHPSTSTSWVVER